jgi:hypothetical protein
MAAPAALGGPPARNAEGSQRSLACIRFAAKNRVANVGDRHMLHVAGYVVLQGANPEIGEQGVLQAQKWALGFVVPNDLGDVRIVIGDCKGVL